MLLHYAFTLFCISIIAYVSLIVRADRAHGVLVYLPHNFQYRIIISRLLSKVLAYSGMITLYSLAWKCIC